MRKSLCKVNRKNEYLKGAGVLNEVF
jgi:hypothetical protein